MLYSSIIIIIIIIVIIDKVFFDNIRGSLVMILEKDTAKHIAVPIVLVPQLEGNTYKKMQPCPLL